MTRRDEPTYVVMAGRGHGTDAWLGFILRDRTQPGGWRLVSVEEATYQQAEGTLDDALTAIGSQAAKDAMASHYLEVKRFAGAEDGQGDAIWSWTPASWASAQ